MSERLTACVRLAALVTMLGLVPVQAEAQNPGSRLDVWQGSFGWRALRSQREMAIDEPISNVMHIEGHNSYNSTGYDAYHTVPVAGPNQILRIEQQLDAGARVVELDVHHLTRLTAEFCFLDNPVTWAGRIKSGALDPLDIQLQGTGVPNSTAAFALAQLDSILAGEIDDFDDVAGALGNFFKSLLDILFEIFDPLDPLNFGCANIDYCVPGFPQEGVPNFCTLPAEFTTAPFLGGNLFVAHEGANDFGRVIGFGEYYGLTAGVPVPINGERKYEDAVKEVAKWLKKPGNENEVVLLEIEDGAHLFKADELVETLVDELKLDGSSLIYTPDDRGAERWPTRNELLQAGKRVVIFDFRGRSFPDYEVRSPSSRRYQSVTHEYLGSKWSFRRDSGEDPDHGNWLERPINKYAPREGDIDDDIERIQEEEPDNEDQFFGVTGDGLTFPGLGDAGNAPIRAADVAAMAVNNVNVIKMDFLLGADVGILDSLDYELPEGLPGERMTEAVWSWRANDPAVFRWQGPVVGNGRDYVVQLPNSMRWESTPDAPDATDDRRYACISAERVPRDSGFGALLEYQWRITGRRGPWIEGNDACRAEFERFDVGGEQLVDFVFAGPVNGHRNARIYEARRDAGALDEAVWLNVNDVDEDGFWLVNRSALARVVPPTLSVPEGSEAQGSVPFERGSTAIMDPSHQVVLLNGSDPFGPSFDPDEELRPGDAARAFAWSWSYEDPKSQGIEPSAGLFVHGVLDPAFPDDGVTTVELTLTDGHLGGQGSDAVPVTVQNVDPETAVTGLDDETGGDVADKLGVAIEGLELALRAIFSDAGRYDTHQAAVDWMDGNVTETPDLDVFVPATDGEGGELSASHPYLEPGEYTIRVHVTDDDAGTGTDTRAVEVVSAARAMELGAALLAEILADPGTTGDAAAHLEGVLRHLLGSRMGLGENGAFDKLADGEWNAGLLVLVRAMRALEDARDVGLAGDPSFERAACFLSLGAKSVAAKQLLLLVRDQAHPQEVAEEASALIASADLLRESGELAAATDVYRLAQRAVQGFTVPGR